VLLTEPWKAAVAGGLGGTRGTDLARTVAPLVDLVGAGNLVELCALDPERATPSRFTVLKPGSMKLTE
jgi:hypothetical protein